MRSSLQSEFATNSKSRHAKKKFSDHTDREVLAIAFASEEEDGRIYMSFAENLAERYRIQRGSSSRWRKRKRPSPHALYEQRFGPNLPPIRREDVKGFLRCEASRSQIGRYVGQGGSEGCRLPQVPRHAPALVGAELRELLKVV
jgi:hypothetical protein